MIKKWLIQIFTFLGGIYFFLEFYLPENFYGLKLNDYNDEFSLSIRIIGAMALGLGVINILMIHVPRVIFLKKNMINSLGLLIGLTLMVFVSVADWWSKEEYIAPANHYSMLSEYAQKLSKLESLEQANGMKLLQDSFNGFEVQASISQTDNISVRNLKEKLQTELLDTKNYLQLDANNIENYFTELSVKLNILSGVYRQVLSLEYQTFFIYQFNLFVFEGLFVALGSAMFSLLGFYVASAAYRAFRIRSFESALMMLAAVLVMLGQIPFGVWIWDGFTGLRLWLLEVPNSAAFRAIALGAGVASLIMALRMWLSIETSYGKGEGE